MPAFESSSERQTRLIAAALAETARPGDMFLLDGPLGAGKSAFARGFIRSLCGEDTDVPSPTFTLVQTYDSPNGPIYHFDLYRLGHPDEIFELGLEDALAGISLVEWPERAESNLPAHARLIRIAPLGGDARVIHIDPEASERQ